MGLKTKHVSFQDHILHLRNPVYYVFNGPWLYNVPLFDRLQLSQWDQKQNTFLFQDHILHLLNPVYYVFNGPWLCNVPLFDRLRVSQWDSKQDMFLFQDHILHLLNPASVLCFWDCETKNKIRFHFRVTWIYTCIKYQINIHLNQAPVAFIGPWVNVPLFDGLFVWL